MARPKKAMEPLSDKHYRAVAEYFDNGFNKARAMQAAGFAKSTSEKQACRMFSLPQVQVEVNRRHAIADKSSGLDREWVVSRLMALADSAPRLNKYIKHADDGTLFYDFTEATAEDLQYIGGITSDFYSEGHGDAARIIKKFKVDKLDPLGVLTALARIEGLFNDRLKLEGDEGIVEALQAGRRRAGKTDEADS